MYLSKFCLHLGKLVPPLRDLIHLKQELTWADQHTKAFQDAKDLVFTALCLRYFGINSPDILHVDTSDYGVGVVFFSNQNISSVNSSESERKPVVYSSSSLTPTEQNFVQTEKETLAILHALHKLDHMFFSKADII